MTTELKVLGLDLSLSATGIATSLGPKVYSPVHKEPVPRLQEFREWIGLIIEVFTPNLVVIENYAFGAKFAREVMGELQGVIKLALLDADVPIALVAPMSLKKYATGSGKANKDEMIGHAVRLGCPANNNNAVDAWWLRNMALTAFNSPDALKLPKLQTDVAHKITWPEVKP